MQNLCLLCFVLDPWERLRCRYRAAWYPCIPLRWMDVGKVRWSRCDISQQLAYSQAERGNFRSWLALYLRSLWSDHRWSCVLDRASHSCGMVWSPPVVRRPCSLAPKCQPCHRSCAASRLVVTDTAEFQRLISSTDSHQIPWKGRNPRFSPQKRIGWDRPSRGTTTSAPWWTCRR